MQSALIKAQARAYGLGLLLLVVITPSPSHAGIWIPPSDATDTVPIVAWKPFTLLRLGPPDGPPLILDMMFHGSGQMTINRDLVESAFVQQGLDTINAEIAALHLQGTLDGFTAEIIVGLGQGFAGFAPLFEPTRGQIQDLAGSPQDGVINFPADSIFDVFFDVWFDLNGDGNVNVGEVFSNNVVGIDNHALRMRNETLSAVPPPAGEQYLGFSMIHQDDPSIGTFQANQLPFPVEFYRIDEFRNPLAVDQGQPFALGGEGAIYEVIPEPSGLTVWGFFAALGIFLGYRRRYA